MSIIQLLSHDVQRALFFISRNSEFTHLQKMRKNSSDKYSYKQFDDTMTIFIHIPKAAGVSVCKSIYGNLAGGHTSVSRYLHVFSKKDFYSYFKFTFVRNPWDRLFSAYTFLSKGGFNQMDRDWATENISQYSSFEQFVTEWVTKENIRKYIHFIPQTNLLFLPGTLTIPVDFIGFFENIQEDFSYIAKKMDKKISLAHLNITDQKKRGYMENYNNTMIDIVEKVYNIDIDTFGYSYDNSTLKQQLSKRSKGELIATL